MNKSEKMTNARKKRAFEERKRAHGAKRVISARLGEMSPQRHDKFK